MKTIMMAGVLSLFSLGAFAANPVAATKAAPQTKAAQTHAVVSKAEAKKECQMEGKKDKDLRSCVKEKIHGSQS